MVTRARSREGAARSSRPGVLLALATLSVVAVSGGLWASSDHSGGPTRDLPGATTLGPYGARAVGPSEEHCTTTGTRVRPGPRAAGRVAAARPGDTLLLSAGRYEDLRVPSGRPGRVVTVKPYDCATVVLTGGAQLGSYTTLAGVRVEAPDEDWVLRIGSDSSTPTARVTVRHATIRGGTIEAVRIVDNTEDVTIAGSDLDGGRDNHVLKVVSESGDAHPRRITVEGNTFHKDYYGTAHTEDLVQAEGHESLTLVGNTFGHNPGEDAVDVKTGTGGVTVRGNYFEGSSIRGECVLVQGDGGDNLVEGNAFGGGCTLSVGAHLADSTAVLRENRLVDSEVRLRRSVGVTMVRNVLVRGSLELGTTEDDDQPRRATLDRNVLSHTEIRDRATPAGRAYACLGNVLFDLRGDRLHCRDTTTSDPGADPTPPR